MALSKKQKAERAQRKIDDARLMLAQAEAEGVEAGIVSDSGIASPFIGGETHRHSNTVWIACKLPKGLILQCCVERKMDRPVFGGAVKEVSVFMRDGEQVRLKGYAVPFGKVPNYPIIGDFGLTEVKRSFWETWLEQNKNLDVVKQGLIYVHGERASVEAYALEHEALRCGLEPLEPNDKRVDKIASDNLSDIEPDTERSAKVKVA